MTSKSAFPTTRTIPAPRPRASGHLAAVCALKPGESVLLPGVTGAGQLTKRARAKTGGSYATKREGGGLRVWRLTPEP